MHLQDCSCIVLIYCNYFLVLLLQRFFFFFSWLSPLCWRESACWSVVALPTFTPGRGQDWYQTAPLHLIKGWPWKQSLLCTTVASRPHLLCFCLSSSQGWRAAAVDFVFRFKKVIHCKTLRTGARTAGFCGGLCVRIWISIKRSGKKVKLWPPKSEYSKFDYVWF